MKKIKYIIGILLIFTGFLFTGELYIHYLDNFQESYYRANFSFTDTSENLKDSDIINDFLLASQRHNIDFFVVSSKIISDYKKTITVYGTEKALIYLKNKGLMEKKNSSLFTGETEVIFNEFTSIPNVRTIDNWYFIGGYNRLNDMHEFKAELINQYGGGFPKLYGSETETLVNFIYVWCAIFFIILLLSLYDVFFQKKEIIVKLLLGEDLNYIFLKNIITDISIYLFAIIFFPLCLKSVSNITFKFYNLILIFILFLVFDTVINATVFRIDIKKDFSNSKGSKTILLFNYVVKVISSIMTIILLSSNIGIVANGLNYYRQRHFFETNKDYNYYQLNYKIHNNLGKSDEDTSILQQTFYKKFQDNALEYIDLSNNLGVTYPTLLVNQSTIRDLINNFPQLDLKLKNNSDKKLYVLVPNGINNNLDKINQSIEIYNFYFNCNIDNSYEIITYKDTINITGISTYLYSYRSKMIKNPIILFDNSMQQIDVKSASRQIYYAYDVMYKVSQKDFESFIEEYKLENQIVIKTNVYDHFKYNWAIIKRTIKLNTIISIFLMFVEMMLIIYIIRLEYSINSVEVCIKKVFGYNLFERNKKIVLLTLISSFFSILLSLFLNVIYKWQDAIYLLSGSIILLIIELIYIYFKIKAIEKSNISTIIRGGRL